MYIKSVKKKNERDTEESTGRVSSGSVERTGRTFLSPLGSRRDERAGGSLEEKGTETSKSFHV